MANCSIKPGQVWLDTDGNRIQAHGGSIHYENDVFYWYGENKEKTNQQTGVWHWGVRCYSSQDLYNWKDEGVIIPPNEEDIGSPLHPKSQMDRPHIIYNKHTRKYVCWLKIMGANDIQTETVLTADSLLGPYTIVNMGLRPLGMSAGDFDLITDPHDGKAYYFFERVHSELICADLTDDYTNVSGYYSTHFPYGKPPKVREAPAYFFRKGKHYLFTSGTTGYFPNPSEVACADTYHGPWSLLGDPHRGDKSRTSFNSQITSVFKHPHKKDLYIALADRWLLKLPEIAGKEAFDNGLVYERMAKVMSAMYGDGVNSADPPQAGSAPNLMDSIIDTKNADYVWLPVCFDTDGTPHLEWCDEWRVENYS
jgi:hypothetical protein